jgi:hypothetical protein
VHIEFQISEADYLDAMHLHALSQRGGWIRIYVLAPMFLLLALPVFALCFMSWRMALILFPVGMAMAQPAINIFLNRRRLRRLYRDNIGLQSRNFVDLDERGDHSRDVASDKFASWESFYAYTEGRHTFLRHFGDGKRFYITPKRELTAAQIDEFRRLLKTHLPERPAQPTGRSILQFTAASAAVAGLVWFTKPSLTL